MRLRRREALPEAVRSLDLPERRLAWAVTDLGDPLVATPTSLYVGSDPVAWVDVEKASWQPPTLVVTEVAEVEGQGRRRAFTLAEDDGLAQVVHAQVTGSVAWSDRRRLDGGGAVRLVGRRVPGLEVLQWQAVWERAEDLLDPLRRAQVEQWVLELRRAIG